MRKFINPTSLVVSLIWVITVLFFCLLNEKKEKQIYQLISERDRIRHTSDSIHAWIFALDVELSRFQRANEYLEKTNPEASKEWERFYSLETE